MKAVSEIRKDSIRITDKEGYDVKNIKQKKNRKSFIGKRNTYKLIFQFSKKKKKLFFFEKKERKRNLVFKKDSQKSKFTRN